MSITALTVAINAYRPSEMASSSVAPSAITPGMSGMVNMKPSPSVAHELEAGQLVLGALSVKPLSQGLELVNLCKT